LRAALAAHENPTERDLSDKLPSARSICVHPLLSAFIGGLLLSSEKSPRRHGAGSFLALFSQ
jgi:hypothetical protein